MKVRAHIDKIWNRRFQSLSLPQRDKLNFFVPFRITSLRDSFTQLHLHVERSWFPHLPGELPRAACSLLVYSLPCTPLGQSDLLEPGSESAPRGLPDIASEVLGQGYVITVGCGGQRPEQVNPSYGPWWVQIVFST